MCTKNPHTIIPEKKAPCSVLVVNNYFLDLLDYPSVLSQICNRTIEGSPSKQKYKTNRFGECFRTQRELNCNSKKFG